MVDTMDLQIIRSLTRNARKPFRTIAQELDVSDATIRKRVKRLQRDGVIRAFNLMVDYDKMGQFIKAFIGLKINPLYLTEIVEALKTHPDVQVMYRTTGSWDLFIEVIYKDMRELNWFLEKKLVMEGILDSEVNVVIGPYKRCPCTNI
jgi:DNA-binding Lrp family transcriptional regulator